MKHKHNISLIALTRDQIHPSVIDTISDDDLIPSDFMISTEYINMADEIIYINNNGVIRILKSRLNINYFIKNNNMYNYRKERQRIFTEDGFDMYLKIQDKVIHPINKDRVFTVEEVISGVYGDSWLMLACIDMMVERGLIREIEQKDVMGQHRAFVVCAKYLWNNSHIVRYVP